MEAAKSVFKDDSKSRQTSGPLLFPKALALIFPRLVAVGGRFSMCSCPISFVWLMGYFFPFVSLTIYSFLTTFPKGSFLGFCPPYLCACYMFRYNLTAPLPLIETSLTRDWDDGSKYQTAQLCAEWVDSHSCNLIFLYLLLLRATILKLSRKDWWYAVREELNCLLDGNYASGGNYGWIAI